VECNDINSHGVKNTYYFSDRFTYIERIYPLKNLKKSR